MILIAFTRNCGDVSDLEKEARRLFPTKKCAEYIGKICGAASEESVCERLSALVLLGELCKEQNVRTDSLSLARDACGRPYFEDSPLDFSITHSHGISAVALCDSGKVGIDIEASELDVQRFVKLARRYFSDLEAEKVEKAPEIFAQLWTEKEAAFKVMGGRLTDLLSTDSDLLKKSGLFFDCREIYGYPMTICANKEPQEIKIVKKSLLK